MYVVSWYNFSIQVTLSFLLGWTQTFTLKPNIKNKLTEIANQSQCLNWVEFNDMPWIFSILMQIWTKIAQNYCKYNLEPIWRDNIMDELMWIIIFKKTERYSWRIARTWKKGPYIMLNYYIVCCFFFWNEHLCKYEDGKEKKQKRWLLEYIENNGSSSTMRWLLFPIHNTSISTDDVKKLQA